MVEAARGLVLDGAARLAIAEGDQLRFCAEAGILGGSPIERLSDREFEVARMLASGKSVKEIAGAMSLSVKTISTYRTRVLEKMDLRTTAELMHYVINHGLIP